MLCVVYGECIYHWSLLSPTHSTPIYTRVVVHIHPFMKRCVHPNKKGGKKVLFDHFWMVSFDSNQKITNPFGGKRRVTTHRDITILIHSNLNSNRSGNGATSGGKTSFHLHFSLAHFSSRNCVTTF